LVWLLLAVPTQAATRTFSQPAFPGGDEDAIEAQRRLADRFGTCAAARAHYGADGLSRETRALLDGKTPKPGALTRLVFIHVPKTAGSTIERLHWTRESQKAIGPHQRVRKTLRSFVMYNGTQALRNPQIGVGGCRCSAWHTPPRLVLEPPWRDVTPYLGHGLPAPGMWRRHERFCVVRDPLDRMLSEIRMWKGGRGDESSTEKKLCQSMLEVRKQTCRAAWANCHYWPQWEYVWSESGDRTCEHVLYFDDVKKEFDALMRLWGDPSRLPRRDKSCGDVLCKEQASWSHHNGEVGNVANASEVRPRMATAVRCRYRMDMCLLGLRLEDGTRRRGDEPDVFERCRAFDKIARGEMC